LRERSILPYDVEALLGITYLGNLKFSEAVGFCEEALRDSSQATKSSGIRVFTLYWGLGNAYSKLENGEKSLAAFRRAVTFSDADARTWCDYGVACLKFLQRVEAYPALERALKIDSTNSPALYFLGQEYLANPQKREEGRKLLERLVRTDKDGQYSNQARELLKH
jgi:tetratricopeptide (TPR) repeat protein